MKLTIGLFLFSILAVSLSKADLSNADGTTQASSTSECTGECSGSNATSILSNLDANVIQALATLDAKPKKFEIYDPTKESSSNSDDWKKNSYCIKTSFSGSQVFVKDPSGKVKRVVFGCKKLSDSSSSCFQIVRTNSKITFGTSISFGGKPKSVDVKEILNCKDEELIP